MSTTTPNLGLVKPTDSEVVDVAVINANMDLIDALDPRLTALEAENRQFYGLAAAIGTGDSATAKEGDTYQESDGNKVLWKRVGGAWVTNEGGVYVVRPTTVTGGTVNSDGSITPTAAAAALSVDGVFTTRFSTYVIQFAFRTTVASSLLLQLRAATVALGTNVYYNQALNSVAAAASAASGLLTHVALSASAASVVNAGEVIFRHPAHANHFKQGDYRNGGNDVYRVGRWQANGTEANSYDGFAISLSAGAFVSGPQLSYVKIYAYL